jgi:hypothetical protein
MRRMPANGACPGAGIVMGMPMLFGIGNLAYRSTGDLRFLIYQRRSLLALLPAYRFASTRPMRIFSQYAHEQIEYTLAAAVKAE